VEGKGGLRVWPLGVVGGEEEVNEVGRAGVGEGKLVKTAVTGEGLMMTGPTGVGPVGGFSGHSGMTQQVGSCGSGTMIQLGSTLGYVPHLRTHAQTTPSQAAFINTNLATFSFMTYIITKSTAIALFYYELFNEQF
jgi:hypothetical protein